LPFSLEHDVGSQRLRIIFHDANLVIIFSSVLVDEASMMDIQMASALIKALPTNCQLVLVGDPNQLPPVGPGHVLAELLSLRVARSAMPPGFAASTTTTMTTSSAVAGYATAVASATSGRNNTGVMVHLMPRVHLGEVFRQDGSGSIVSGALQIMQGEILSNASYLLPTVIASQILATNYHWLLRLKSCIVDMPNIYVHI
jgi:hypothetical protein